MTEKGLPRLARLKSKNYFSLHCAKEKQTSAADYSLQGFRSAHTSLRGSLLYRNANPFRPPWGYCRQDNQGPYDHPRGERHKQGQLWKLRCSYNG